MMEQNGGSTKVSKDAQGRTIISVDPANVETCSICHGAGGVADVSGGHRHNAAPVWSWGAAVRGLLSSLNHEPVYVKRVERGYLTERITAVTGRNHFDRRCLCTH